MTLPPLGQVETAGLVSSMLDDGPVSEAFAAFLHEHTEGLPLLIEESVRLLWDRSDLLRVGGEWMRRSLDEMQVPPTVRDAVLERLQRLRPATLRVLDAAAVLGDPADEGLLREVAGLAPNRVQTGIDQALSSGLLQENERGRFGFRHALMGRAVYEAIPPPARWRLHLRAGSALEATSPQPVGQLVRHFREATDDERWCRYAIQAAERAIASDDHTAAVVMLNDVLVRADLPPQTQAQLAQRLALATVFRRDAVDDLDRQVARTLRDLLDRGVLAEQETAEIRGVLGRLLNRLGDFEAAMAEMELAIPHLGHKTADTARYMINLGLPAGRWPVSVHLRWLRRAAEAESRISTPIDRLTLTVDRASALLMLGEEDGWAAAAEIPSTAPSTDERRQIARGYFNVGSAALVWGRYAEAQRRLTAALDFADADQYARLRPHILVALAELKWFTGVWEGLAEEATALAALDEIAPSARRVTDRIIGRIHASRGARDRTEEHANRALDEARRSGALDELLEPAAALGRLHLHDQRVGDALEVTDEPMQILLTKGIWVWATDIAPVRVEALVAAGETDGAARLVATFTRGLRGRNAPAPRAALAVCRAQLAAGSGDQARAAAAFARAARAWEALPRAYDALRCREREATCLLAAGRVEQGIALLSDVHRQLSIRGAVGDLGRVERALREHGVNPPRPWRGGQRGYGDRLSPHELEVVRLVVAGKTDQQIARVLSKSPRTVAVQIKSAKRKLGVSSRTALAVHAMRAGIVPPADKTGRRPGRASPAP